jgi:hypothetical protein
MNLLTVIGVILALIGAIGLIYGAITYSSHTDVVEFGSLKLQARQSKQIPLSPVASGALLVAGGLLVVIGLRSRNRDKSSVK